MNRSIIILLIYFLLLSGEVMSITGETNYMDLFNKIENELLKNYPLGESSTSNIFKSELRIWDNLKNVRIKELLFEELGSEVLQNKQSRINFKLSFLYEDLTNNKLAKGYIYSYFIIELLPNGEEIIVETDMFRVFNVKKEGFGIVARILSVIIPIVLFLIIVFIVNKNK